MNMKTLPNFWFEPRPWIDGQWQAGGESIDVRNPATGEKISAVTRADAATVQRAIEGQTARPPFGRIIIGLIFEPPVQQ